MSTTFDPYLEWLGLTTNGHAPNHYQLLGLTEFEGNPAAITAAADERMAEIRKRQAGPRGQYTHKLLNEITVAKLCLLNERTKAKYDAQLARERAVAQAALAPQVYYEPEPTAPDIVAPDIAAPPQTPPSALSRKSPAAIKPWQVAPVADEEPVQGGAPAWLFAVAALAALVVLAALAAYLIPQPKRDAPLLTKQVDTPIAPLKEQEPESQPETEAIVITQEGNGDLNLPLSVAELAGELARETTGDKTLLHGWQHERSVARWHFKLVRPAVFQMKIVYQATRPVGGVWELRVGEHTKSREIASTEADESYVDEFIWKITRGGEQVLELSAHGLPADAQVALESLRLQKVDLGQQE
jgi:hypothetical protein